MEILWPLVILKEEFYDILATGHLHIQGVVYIFHVFEKDNFGSTVYGIKQTTTFKTYVRDTKEIAMMLLPVQFFFHMTSINISI